MTPDSANTATAMYSGVKCREGVLGANQHVVRTNCSSLHGNEVDSVMRMAMLENGKYSGGALHEKKGSRGKLTLKVLNF